MKKAEAILYSQKIAAAVAEFGIEDPKAWEKILTLIHQSLTQSQKTTIKNAEKYSDTFKLYASEYKKRYSIEPAPSAKSYTLCKALREYVGGEEANQVIIAYLADSDPWLIKQAHPLTILVANYQKYFNSAMGVANTKTSAKMQSASTAISDYVRQKNAGK